MASRFARATGNSNTAGTWSATSGGGSDGAGLNAGDDVIFDSASGAINVTFNASISVRSLDCSGLSTGASGSPFAGTLTHSAAINITVTGDDSVTPGGGPTIRLVSGMTYTPAATALWTIQNAAAAATSTLTSGGKTFPLITINITDAGNASKVLLGDNLAMTANTGALTVTDGVLDYNNKNISSGTLVCSGAAVRTLTPGSATHTITTITGTPVNFGTNVTISANTATLDAVAVATGTRSFLMNPTANGNFNNFSVTNASLNAQFIQFQTNSFTIAGNITFTNVRNIVIFGGISMICSGTFGWTGPGSSTPGSLTTNVTAGAISVAGSVSVDWIYIENFTFTGTWTSLNSFSAGLSTGIGLTISPPSISGGSSSGRIIGG